jgi:hypothetical protein
MKVKNDGVIKKIIILKRETLNKDLTNGNIFKLVFDYMVTVYALSIISSVIA